MTANALGQLGELVRGQRLHDERAHRDVYYLSSVHRMTHLTQHVSKYAARLVPGRPHIELNRELVERTIVDTTLIALSASELLRIDLTVLVPSDEEIVDFDALGRYRAKLAGDAVERPQWFLHRLVAIAGDMSKALESLDHLEAYPYREALNSCGVQLLDACLVAAATRRMDLLSLVRSRWQQLEQSAVLGAAALEEPNG